MSRVFSPKSRQWVAATVRLSESMQLIGDLKLAESLLRRMVRAAEVERAAEEAEAAATTAAAAIASSSAAVHADQVAKAAGPVLGDAHNIQLAGPLRGWTPHNDGDARPLQVALDAKTVPDVISRRPVEYIAFGALLPKEDRAKIKARNESTAGPLVTSDPTAVTFPQSLSASPLQMQNRLGGMMFQVLCRLVHVLSSGFVLAAVAPAASPSPRRPWMQDAGQVEGALLSSEGRESSSSMKADLLEMASQTIEPPSILERFSPSSAAAPVIVLRKAEGEALESAGGDLMVPESAFASELVQGGGIHGTMGSALFPPGSALRPPGSALRPAGSALLIASSGLDRRFSLRLNLAQQLHVDLGLEGVQEEEGCNERHPLEASLPFSQVQGVQEPSASKASPEEIYGEAKALILLILEMHAAEVRSTMLKGGKGQRKASTVPVKAKVQYTSIVSPKRGPASQSAAHIAREVLASQEAAKVTDKSVFVAIAAPRKFKTRGLKDTIIRAEGTLTLDETDAKTSMSPRLRPLRSLRVDVGDQATSQEVGGAAAMRHSVQMTPGAQAASGSRHLSAVAEERRKQLLDLARNLGCHSLELRSAGLGHEYAATAVLSAQLQLLILQQICGQGDPLTITASACVVDLLFCQERYEEARQHLQGHISLPSMTITNRSVVKVMGP